MSDDTRPENATHKEIKRKKKEASTSLPTVNEQNPDAGKDKKKDKKSKKEKKEKKDKKDKKRKREEGDAEDSTEPKKSKKDRRKDEAEDSVIQTKGVDVEFQSKSIEAAEAEQVLEEVIEKKEKKEKKSKKRKHTDEPENASAEAVEGNGEGKKSKKSKKDKKDKKDKKSVADAEIKASEEATESIAINGATTGQDEIPMPREPTKKELKELKRKAKQNGETTEPATATEADPISAGDDLVQLDSEAPVNKNQRFVVFVGNLSYSATKDTLEKHFAKVSPTEIRLMTHKDGKSKGFAFMDFDHYDKMKTCLKLYHHTLVDGRKVNIELTAGGGGNSADRKAKIQAKNEKLHDERQRRHLEEEKKKQRQDKKAERQQNSKAGKNANAMGSGNPMGLDGTADTPDTSAPEDHHAGIHPSRLARLGL